MKSLLVDALRQAKNGETPQTLSDSGSFDTADADFGRTANDEDNREAVAAKYDDDLSPQRDSTVSDENPDENAEPSENPSVRAASDRRTANVPAERAATAAVGVSRPVPVLSRFSPVLCVLLALIASGSWLLFHMLGTSFLVGNSVIASSGIADGIEQADTNNPATTGGTTRFPYIDGPATKLPVRKPERAAP